MIAGQVQNKANNAFKVANLVLPVSTFKGCLEESGIGPRKEENKRFMRKAGDTGDGG